jgi:hypothetical protein
MATFNILFDQWGTQVQVQQTLGGKRLNTLLGAIESAGTSSGVTWSSSFSADPLTAEQLTNADVLVILTRASIHDRENQKFAYSSDEITAITSFVGAGNGLLLISNHPNYGVNDAVLAESFQVTIDTTNFISMPGEPPTRPMMVMSGSSLNTADLTLAPLFLGVDSLSTHDACGISSSLGTARTLASFPSGAVANGSGPPPKGEGFGVLVPYDSGQVIVLGNSGICGDNGGTLPPSCGTITYGSNLMFLLNCLRFLGGQPQAFHAGQCPKASSRRSRRPNLHGATHSQSSPTR